MRNRLLIVTLVVILLGVVVGTPLYVLGKQKTELKGAIAQFEETNLELQNTISELGTNVAAKSDMIAELLVTIAGVKADKAALQASTAELETEKATLQAIITGQGDTIAELNANNTELQAEKESLQQTITQLEVTISELQNNVSEKNNTISELEATISEQSDTIANFEAEKEARLSQAQELYDFAISALEIAEEIKQMVSYALTIPGGTSDKVNDALFRIEEIENILNWLYAPPDAVEAKTSLFRQLDLTTRFLALVHLAYLERDRDNIPAYEDYLESAIYMVVNEIWPLQEQNERDLINLQLQAEQDLNQ